MKLLYITNGIVASGGLERVLSVKASAFAELEEREVHILVLNDAWKNPFYPFSSQIRFHSVQVAGPLLRYFRQYKKGIQDVVDSIEPDIISVCDDGVKGFFLPRLIRTSARWIYERHASIMLNGNKTSKGRILRKVMRSQVSNFDAFVVLTTANAAEWNKKNVFAISNPLSFETDEISTTVNKTVIAVGSHSYNKGYDLLIEIWKKIERTFPDWSLHIYGRADPARTFIHLAEEKELRNIHFFAPVQDIKKKYLESSVLVLTSRSEGFGMVLTEAMECGVPCVSFDCPSGPADIIQSGTDGFLIPNGDTDAFYNALSTLIENSDLRKTLGTAAKQNVQRFSRQNILDQWETLFQSLTS